MKKNILAQVAILILCLFSGSLSAGEPAVINVVNRHEKESIETKIDLQTGNYSGKANINFIHTESIEATNTLEKTPISIKTNKINFKGNMIKHAFPAHSFSQIEIPLQ